MCGWIFLVHTDFISVQLDCVVKSECYCVQVNYLLHTECSCGQLEIFSAY